MCPVCFIPMKYYCRDSQMHHSMWVLTEESRKHLAEAHIQPEVTNDLPEVRKAKIPIRNYRGRRVLRLPSSKRRVLV